MGLMNQKKILAYLALFVFITVAFGTIYAVTQQNERLSANDPQIQMAEDAAAGLNNGEAFQSVIPPDRVDIAESLSSFIVVYDDSRKPLASSGYLHDEMPDLPAGVFAYTRVNGEDRFTWQPERGVRVAAVVARYNGGFVVAGRSLREVEKREDWTLLQVVIAWAVSIAIAGVTAYVWETKKEEL